MFASHLRNVIVPYRLCHRLKSTDRMHNELSFIKNTNKYHKFVRIIFNQFFIVYYILLIIILNSTKKSDRFTRKIIAYGTKQINELIVYNSPTVMSIPVGYDDEFVEYVDSFIDSSLTLKS